MPILTHRLGILAAAGAMAVFFAPRPVYGFWLVNVGVVLLAAVDWLLTVSPRRLEIEREMPAVVALDTTAEVVWRVRNPSRRRVHLHIADELVPSLRPTSRRASMTVPRGARATARTQINPSRRGLFTLHRITVRTEGPIRLAGRQRTLELAGALRVYPPFRSRREAELRMDRNRQLQVGLRAAQGRGGGTEFDSLREYGIDDEFRRIDWAATARARKPIVRTYRAERNQTVLVLLDTGRTMAGRVALSAEVSEAAVGNTDSIPRLDHAMDAVMMMTAVATRLGDRTGLVCFGDRVRAVVPPHTGRHQLSAVTDAMYQLEPQLAESDYRGAFADTLTRFRRRALLVVLTELASQALPETLIPALPMVVRTHLVVIAAVRDPEVEYWARQVPTEAATAFRKAAAVQALDQRTRTISWLRSLGAVVVDALPGRLAPELADAYLNVKATGRL
ncbi:MAG: DUF58 domain-containing protein [Nitriliruptorales bacterium]|nr:DUF58 domain-containing protein [Nitriliruptorales bacterium]